MLKVKDYLYLFPLNLALSGPVLGGCLLEKIPSAASHSCLFGFDMEQCIVIYIFSKIMWKVSRNLWVD